MFRENALAIALFAIFPERFPREWKRNNRRVQNGKIIKSISSFAEKKEEEKKVGGGGEKSVTNGL